MAWSNLNSRTFNVDWASTTGPAIDPYLLWADSTRLVGVRAALLRADELRVDFEKALPGALIPIAFEHAGPWSALLAALASHPRTTALAPPIRFATRFGTWSVPVELLQLLYKAPLKHLFKRIELGLPTRAPGSTYAQLLTKPDSIVVADAKRVFAAVIDDGCAFANLAFLTTSGASPPRAARLARLWFQEDKTPVSSGNRFLGYSSTELDDFLNAAKQHGRLDESTAYAALEDDLRRRVSPAAADSWRKQTRLPATHGTHVLDVMAGTVNPLASQGFGREVDPSSAAPLIFVQLPHAAVEDTSGASMNVNVMEALTYIATAVPTTDDVVVNLSYGALAGPHDGTTLLEEAIDDYLVCNPHVVALTLPAGNGYDSCTHARRALPADKSVHEMQFSLLPCDPTDSFVEIWYSPEDSFLGGQATVVVEVLAPDGTSSGPVRLGQYVEWLPSAGIPIASLLHVKSPTAGGGRKHMALLTMAATRPADPARGSAPHGRWTVRLTNEGTCDTVAYAWIERDDSSFGSGRSRSQATFCSEGTFPARGVRHGAVEPVARQSCMNSFAHGAKPWVAGGYVLQARVGMAETQPVQALAAYSASGPGREFKGSHPGPNLCAPCERVPGLGLLAAGTRSVQRAYMNGTSVASAALGRQLVNEACGDKRPPPTPYVLDPVSPHGKPYPPPQFRRGDGRLEPT
jgi:hypothetical protein